MRKQFKTQCRRKFVLYVAGDAKSKATHLISFPFAQSVNAEVRFNLDDVELSADEDDALFLTAARDEDRVRGDEVKGDTIFGVAMENEWHGWIFTLATRT